MMSNTRKDYREHTVNLHINSPAHVGHMTMSKLLWSRLSADANLTLKDIIAGSDITR